MDQEPQVSIAHDQVEFSVDERYRRIVEQIRGTTVTPIVSAVCEDTVPASLREPA